MTIMIGVFVASLICNLAFIGLCASGADDLIVALCCAPLCISNFAAIWWLSLGGRWTYRSLESVVKELRDGLRDGSIVLEPKQKGDRDGGRG